MKKEFNITGICYPEHHYMMDNSEKVDAIFKLIEKGNYFTINRPRQYGKTTTLYMLEEILENSEGFLPIALNFQGIDSIWHESDKAFAKMFMNELQKALSFSSSELAKFLEDFTPEVQDMNTLSLAITALVRQARRKVVLLIDEVDASSNYEPFLSFLGMLRTKYLRRMRPQDSTFHSIVLVGVYDIKSLKYKLGNPDSHQENSPWNIAIDFNVDMSFSPSEIVPMLEAYVETENISMDIPQIAQGLYYYTSGHPFLVSRLCKIISEDILGKTNAKQWVNEDIDTAVQILLKENNTNFDSLIKNLENSEELYDLVYEVIIEGTVIPFNPDEPMTHLGRVYGIFKENGRLKIHNRIYEQRLYNYMAAKTLRLYFRTSRKRFGDSSFTNRDQTLNLEAILERFQEFMKEQRSEKDISFIEREWRLIFLAFLKPIISGKGHDFREVETSEEKRLDIVVTFFEHKYIIELKIWRGEKKHTEGLDQLVEYLDIQSLKRGYLVIFDTRKEKKWEVQNINYKEKEIFAVWV